MEEKAIVVQNLVKQYPKSGPWTTSHSQWKKGKFSVCSAPTERVKPPPSALVDPYPANIRETLIYNVNTAKNSEEVRRMCGYVPQDVSATAT